MKEPRPILRLKRNNTDKKEKADNELQVDSIEQIDSTEKSIELDNTKSITDNKKSQSKVQEENKKNDKQVNKQAKNKKKLLMSREEYQEHLKYLQKQYPKCFTTPPSPLATKIKAKLIEAEEENLSKTKIRNILRIYANSKAYKDCLILGADRVNLDGTVHSKVTQEHIDKDRTKRSREKSNNTPHDQLIKKVMESPIAAEEFLNEYLPESFKKMINLKTVKAEKDSFVETHLARRLSDVVLSVKTKNNEQAFVYVLIEAQLENDHWIAFRLWKYMLLLCERHIPKQDKNNNKKVKLPLICPILLYHGSKKYNSPMNLWELFTDPEESKKLMANNYQLVDLHAMKDDEINYDKHLSIILYMMKHVHQRDKLKLIEDIFKYCSKAIIIDQEQDYIYMKLMFWYTQSKIPVEKTNQLEKLIRNNLGKNDKENVMKTIADTYIEKGIEIGVEKGEARGVMKTAMNMLKEKADITFISTVTGISSDELLKLQNKQNTAH